MAEASGSGERGPPPSKRKRVSPDSSSPESEAPPRCSCSPRGAGASACCHRSPTAGSKLPASHFYRRSPPHARSKNGSKISSKRKEPKSKKSIMFNKLPRFLWAAFGKVRAPLKRQLRRQASGKAARRLLPWSRARCAVCLYDVLWFEAVKDDDEVGKLMNAVASPRPNRPSQWSHTAGISATNNGAARRLTAIAEEDHRQSLDLAEEHSRERPNSAENHPRQQQDIAEERPRQPLVVIREEEEEREDLAAERDYLEDYGAEICKFDEYVPVRELRDIEYQMEGEPPRKPVRRRLFY